MIRKYQFSVFWRKIWRRPVWPQDLCRRNPISLQLHHEIPLFITIAVFSQAKKLNVNIKLVISFTRRSKVEN
jgi:hypothetical protein